MFADIEDREGLSLAVVARLMFVRTEAIRLRHAVGGAVLTIANQCSACFGEHRGKHPLRGLQVRCGCSAIGAALSATPMRNVMLIEWLSVVALRATTFSVPRGMFPRGRWCLWHRRDSHRLAPLEFERQRSKCALECHHTAGHRVIAKTAVCAQAPSRPEGRARARSKRSAEPCTVPSTERASIA